MPQIPDDLEAHAAFTERKLTEAKTRQEHFASLRSVRNRLHYQWVETFAKENGIDSKHVHTHFNPDTCYCDCSSEPRGECEHNWTGKKVEIENGSSVTCLRCGMPAISHDIRFLP